MKKSAVFLAALTFSVCAYTAPAAPKTYTGVATAPATASEREVAGLFDRWNAALATGKPEAVLELYAPNAILEPTVSNEVRDTPEKIKDYFVHFMQMKPHGVINYRQIRVLDENTALDAGVYTFRLIKDGAPSKVQARYTFVYEKLNGEWRIMNHHSSSMPEKVDVSKL